MIWSRSAERAPKAGDMANTGAGRVGLVVIDDERLP